MAGRKQKNIVDYYPFFVNEGRTSRFIDNKYGNNGIAVWVRILRELGKSENHYIHIGDKKVVLDLISICKLSRNDWWSIINDLVEFDVFDKELLDDFQVLWSLEFTESLEKVYKKRQRQPFYKSDIINYLSDDKKNKSKINSNLSSQAVTEIRQSKVKQSKVKKKLYKKDVDLEVKKRIGVKHFELLTKYEYDYPHGDKFMESLFNWLEYKKEKGKGYRAKKSITMVLNRARKYKEKDVVAAIEKAIGVGWAYFFPNGSEPTQKYGKDYDKQTW